MRRSGNSPKSPGPDYYPDAMPDMPMPWNSQDGCRDAMRHRAKAPRNEPQLTTSLSRLSLTTKGFYSVNVVHRHVCSMVMLHKAIRAVQIGIFVWLVVYILYLSTTSSPALITVSTVLPPVNKQEKTVYNFLLIHQIIT